MISMGSLHTSHYLGSAGQGCKMTLGSCNVLDNISPSSLAAVSHRSMLTASSPLPVIIGINSQSWNQKCLPNLWQYQCTWTFPFFSRWNSTHGNALCENVGELMSHVHCHGCFQKNMSLDFGPSYGRIDARTAIRLKLSTQPFPATTRYLNFSNQIKDYLDTLRANRPTSCMRSKSEQHLYAEPRIH